MSSLSATSRCLSPLVSDPLAGTAPFLWTLRVCTYGTLILAAAFGGPVLTLAALLAGLATPLTDRAGGMCAAFTLAGGMLAVVVLPFTGLPFGLWMARWINVPLYAALGVGVVGVSLLLVVIGAQLGAALGRPLRRWRYPHVLNRALGILAGPFTGGLAVAAGCWGSALFGPALTRYIEARADEQPRLCAVLRPIDRLQRRIMSDPLAGSVCEYNPLAEYPPLVRFAGVAEFAADQHIYWEMLRDGELDGLLRDPAVAPRYQAFKADPQMQAAIKRRDLEPILTSDHFALALDDDGFCIAVAREWPKIRARVSDSQIRRAERAVQKLGGRARANLNRAIHKAEQKGVRVPGT